MIPLDVVTPCQNDPHPFDAVLDRPSKATVEAAKAACAPCGHKEACYLHALSLKLPGVYGGRLLLTKVKPPSRQAPVCVQCGQERAARTDRPGFRGSKGLCDRCYQVDWRKRHNQAQTPNRNPQRGTLDTAKIERAICGELVHLNADEREAAVQLLAGRGLSDPQMAFLLRLSKRSVLRIRQRCGIPPGVPQRGIAS